ncbi:MAG: chemotaxis protein CheW, partial [Syntrophomonadaceae bacterium]|nr:chemotaxis protein CheW [Syntrophomonadaceae bacterium]
MAEEVQLVVFTLASGSQVCEYGVPITQVQEINRLTAPTRLPQVPDFIEGVINLRGKIIPV